MDDAVSQEQVDVLYPLKEVNSFEQLKVVSVISPRSVLESKIQSTNDPPVSNVQLWSTGAGRGSFFDLTMN